MLTFCIGSTTVARPLERNLGTMLEAALLIDSARVSALEEEHFNMVESEYRGCAVQPLREAKCSKSELGLVREIAAFVIGSTREEQDMGMPKISSGKENEGPKKGIFG